MLALPSSAVVSPFASVHKPASQLKSPSLCPTPEGAHPWHISGLVVPFAVLVGWMSSPPKWYVHSLILGTCVTVFGKRVFGDVIYLRILRWGDHPGLPRLALNSITSVLVRSKQRRIQTWIQRQKQRLEWCGSKPKMPVATRNWKKQVMLSWTGCVCLPHLPPIHMLKP